MLSRDQKAELFLAQTINNAASLLETLPIGDDAEEIFDACL